MENRDFEYKIVFPDNRIIIDDKPSCFIGKEPDVMYISKENKMLLDTICNIEVDGECNKTYVCNNLRFKVIPNITYES